MYEAAVEGVARARAGGGPVLIEARTNRWRGHFEGDRQLYRPADELEGLPAHDPLTVQADRLVAAGLLGEEGLNVLERRVVEEVAEAVAFGRGSPEAAPEDALLHVYASSGAEGAGVVEVIR